MSAEELDRLAAQDAQTRDRTAMEAWLEDYEDAQARGLGSGPISWAELVRGGRVQSAPGPRNDSRFRRSGDPEGNSRGARGDANGIRNIGRAAAQAESDVEQLGQTTMSVLDAMGSAVSSHFEAWALGRETMGEALAGMTADLFKWMGQQALKKAGMEAVEAIAAAARYDFGAAALHGAAAVGFAALAGGSFYVSGQVAPGKASTHGRDDAGRSTTRDLGARGEMGGGQTVIFNLSPGAIVGLDQRAAEDWLQQRIRNIDTRDERQRRLRPAA